MQAAFKPLSSRRGVTLSIGAAVVRPNGGHVTPAQLIRVADQCLYQAKQDGRDGARISELSGVGDDSPHVLREHPMNTDALLDSLLQGV